MNFKFWGDGSQGAKDLVDAILVRDTNNFNWSFIFILAVVFYVYWSEIHKKNYAAVQAGLALYGVHWLYEIANAIIAKASGYPLWAVSNQSTTFILLIGVSWELSMMFSLAGIISFKMMPQDRTKRYFARGKFKGISCKLMVAIEMALLFALFEYDKDEQHFAKYLFTNHRTLVIEVVFQSISISCSFCFCCCSNTVLVDFPYQV